MALRILHSAKGNIILTITILYAVQVFQLSTASIDVDPAINVRNSNPTSTPSPPPHQLSCMQDPSICNKVCGEPARLPYSSTFCNLRTGSCVCDCRDKLKEECTQTPFTPCFQDCVKENPNPDAFLYRGGNCPIPMENGTVAYQCACECAVREDYYETNDVI